MFTPSISPTPRRLAYTSKVGLSANVGILPQQSRTPTGGVGEPPLTLLGSIVKRARRIASEQLRLEEEIERLCQLHEKQLKFSQRAHNPNLLELVAHAGIHSIDKNWLSESRLELSIDRLPSFCLAQTPGTLVECLTERGESKDRFVPFKSVQSLATSMKKSLSTTFSPHHIAVLINRLRDTFAVNGANPFWIEASPGGYRLLVIQ